MSWFSDLVSGSRDAEGLGKTAPPPERARQLLEGVASTARAAEGDDQQGLAKRAGDAARRLAESVPGAGAEEQSEALELLDRLHFALLRVVVRGEDPAEAAVEAAVESAEELADRLGGPPGGDGGG